MVLSHSWEVTVNVHQLTCNSRNISFFQSFSFVLSLSDCSPLGSTTFLLPDTLLFCVMWSKYAWAEKRNTETNRRNQYCWRNCPRASQNNTRSSWNHSGHVHLNRLANGSYDFILYSLVISFFLQISRIRSFGLFPFRNNSNTVSWTFDTICLDRRSVFTFIGQYKTEIGRRTSIPREEW